MPGQKVVDPRAQMQGVLGDGGGRSPFLPVLSALARALAGAPQAHVQAMSCRGDVVELHLTAPSVDSLDAITKAFSAVGMSADLQSATPRDAQVEGRLVVKLVRS
jgi:hypothetical protein